MTTDQELVAIVDALKGEAERSLLAQHGPGPLQQGFVGPLEIARPLAEALDNHPEFSAYSSRYFLSCQLPLHPSTQAWNILKVAINRGSSQAIDWYRTVRSVSSTAIRVVGKIYGLSPTETIDFSNGMSLVPLHDLPESANSSSLKQSITMAPGFRFPAAMTAIIEDVHDTNHEDAHARFLEVCSEMRRMIGAFTLADDTSPVLAETWSEFVDPDFAAAEVGRIWQSSASDGAEPFHNVEVTSAALEWVNKYLALDPAARSACDVSLARLNMARRRISPGDQALDGCICLESLLSGKSSGELTHKLSVRVALLLAKSKDERLQVAKDVRAFYQLRSKIVHGSTPNDPKARLVAQRGLELCQAALRTIVQNNVVPNPEEWELTGGPHWNRFVE